MAGTEKFIALDVGAGGAKLALFARHHSGQLELRDYRFADLEASISGEMAQEAVVASVMKQLLDEMHISGLPAVVSLAGHAIFSRLVSLPPVAGDKLEQTIRHEAVQNIPFPIDEVVWDYQLFGDQSGAERDALLVAAKSELVEGLAFAVEATGLSVDAFDTAPSSLYNAVRFSRPELSGSTLVVDMGAQSVDLVFMEGERAFFRTLPLGANRLDTHDLEDASARQLLVRMTQEILRSISFYKTKQGGQAPELILLSGGMAGLEGVEVLLSERLNVPVERLNPLQKITFGSKIDVSAVEAMSYRFGELVGLAVGQSGAGSVSFNLIPPGILKARAFRKLQPLMVACAAVVVLTVAVWSAGLAQLTKLTQAESEQVKARVDALGAICAELKPTELDMAELQRDRAVYLLAVKQHTLWLETLADLRAVVPDGLFLTSLNPVFVGEGSDRSLRGIRIAGVAYLDKQGDDDAIKNFRNQIRQSSRFGDETEVIHSPAKRAFAREFEIEAVLAEAVQL